MKNVKTIITLLVLTMTVFSCQTNDELVELEELNNNLPQTNRNLSDSSLLQETTVKVLVTYPDNVTTRDKILLRRAFESHLDILSFYDCNSDFVIEKKEVWVIDASVSASDFTNIVTTVLIDTTGVADEDEGDIGGVDWGEIIFEYGVDCD